MSATLKKSHFSPVLRKSLLQSTLLVAPAVLAVLVGYILSEKLFYVLAAVMGLLSPLPVILQKLPKVTKVEKLASKDAPVVSTTRPEVKHTVLRVKNFLGKNKQFYSNYYGLVTAAAAVVFSALFTVYTLFRMPAPSVTTAFMLRYYSALASAMGNKSDWLVGAFFGVAAVAVLSSLSLLLIQKSAARRPSRVVAHLLAHLGMVVGASIIGLHLALGTSLVALALAYTQATALLKTHPEKVGLVFGKDAIVENLKKRETSPSVTTATDNVVATFTDTILQKQYHFGGFTTKTLETALPKKFFPKPTIPDSNLILFGDTLLVREIKSDEMQVIGAELSRLLVTQYFYPRNMKPSPQLTVLSRQEYLKFRDDQINDRIAEIDKSIAAAGAKIAGARAAITQIIMRYSYGELSIDDAIRQYQAQQGRLGKLREEQAQLTKQKEFVKLQKETTPYELGIFIQAEPNSIRVVLDATKEDALNEFLVTLVHEHLHYTSYVDKERVLPTFFEEGLTEYFARKIVGQQLHVQAEVGYPVIVRVIQAIAKKVPEQKLADAYFNKDVNMLKAALNEAYGSDFYEQSEFHFMIIPFTDGQQSLKLANDIMSVIGEPDIQESEIHYE